jgi:hypothetical protein
MARRRIPLTERFWKKIKKTDGCWFWPGAINNKGYGHSWMYPNNELAHRIAWQLTYGPIPDGLYVCHHCDNRRCVRPDHLFLGTQQDNLHDMKVKGRHVGSAKLDEATVLIIRSRYAAGGITQQALADQYNVDQGTISHLIQRKTWQRI